MYRYRLNGYEEHWKQTQERQVDYPPSKHGGIPEGLVESELFGHERGAFTGANSRKLGKVELAEGGA